MKQPNRKQLTPRKKGKATRKLVERLQDRPTIIERLVDLDDINLIAKILQAVYEETRNERVRNLLDKFYAMQEKWAELEDQYRQRELLEAHAMIDELPHAMQVYLRDYYDKDME